MITPKSKSVHGVKSDLGFRVEQAPDGTPESIDFASTMNLVRPEKNHHSCFVEHFIVTAAIYIDTHFRTVLALSNYTQRAYDALSTITIWRPSILGWDSTIAISVSSDANLFRILAPRSGRLNSRPLNLMVTLTLSP